MTAESTKVELKSVMFLAGHFDFLLATTKQILTLDEHWRCQEATVGQVYVSSGRLLLLFAQTVLLSGCNGAPSLTIAGAYFPAWLACVVVGVVTTVIARGLMAATHLTTFIPFQLAVCTAIGVLAALTVWLSWVRH